LAEAELGTSKSTISKQMSDLENRLGVRLCNRGRGGFSLTPEGRVVYDSSTAFFASVEDFRVSVNAFHDLISGKLYLGFIDTIVTREGSILHRALKDYSSRYPDVELNIMTGSASEIDRSVQDRTIHIGVSTHQCGLTNVVSVPLFEEDNFLFCGRGHPLFETAPDVALKALREHRFVQHGYSEAEQVSMDQIGVKASAKAHFTEDVLFLILTGNYLGFLPLHYAASYMERGMVHAVAPDQVAKKTEIEMIVNTASMKNALVARFVDVVEGIIPCA
jgi:LysR family transcriptional regulator, transcriptional activator for bauABCD operon